MYFIGGDGNFAFRVERERERVCEERESERNIEGFYSSRRQVSMRLTGSR